ncbi:hypothetical protein Acr_10g0002330 [Actinidia rufa]|uniref:HXXXD-type acyl-transferase family protein n=1 Tax=Actinidia rufa TaxID=165716 RepID=A0A7J0F831_9ERIC|nr:hypothetical protein Acr_10g0002330 [Actinidia rufa]
MVVALVYYYPLAGRLHWTGHGGRVELECNSEGAQLYEAESDAEVGDFSDFCPTPELRALIPLVDYNAHPLHELPLLLVQVTKFRCGGICIGVAISHAIVDGTSSSHFMSSWANIARGEPLDVLPFLNRTTLLARDPPPTRRFNNDRFDPPPLLIGRADNTEERNKGTTVAMLHLSKTQLHKLRDMANVSKPNNKPNYSRFEAVAGHLWRCMCNARDHKSDQITKLYLQVEFRNRMRPPLPEGYFGNAFLRITVTSRAGELTTKPLGYTAGKIREVLAMVTDEYIRSSIYMVKTQQDLTRFRTVQTVGSNQGPFYGNPNLEITSWIFGQPKNDFGWGKEIYLGPGTVSVDGKSYIISGPDEGKSWILALRLQAAHMDAFKTIFYNNISEKGCCRL